MLCHDYEGRYRPFITYLLRHTSLADLFLSAGSTEIYGNDVRVLLNVNNQVNGR